MHLKTQHEAANFACQLCTFIGESGDMLEKHNVEIHVYTCKVCQTKLSINIVTEGTHREGAY